MRKLIWMLLVSACLAQSTPNLNFNIPSVGTPAWGPLVNANFTLLDALLSGTGSLPAIRPAAVNGIQMVDGIKNVTPQAAINAISVTGGTVLVPAGTYPGPTSIPSNTTLLCLNYYFNPASLGGTAGTGTGCHFTYTGSLLIAGVNSVVMDGFWLDFSGTNGTGLTLTSVSYSRFRNMRIDCAGGAVCLTANTTALLGISNKNSMEHIDLNCNASQCVKIQGTTFSQSVTNWYWSDVFLNGPGNVGPALWEWNSNCDSHRIYGVYANIANSAGNGFIFNNTGTPGTNADADGEVIDGLIVNTPGGWTGKALIFNASSGNDIRFAGGLFESQVTVNFPASTTFQLRGAGQITALTAAESWNAGKVCAGVSGCASGAVNGDVSAAQSATAGALRLGSDGTSSIARVSNTVSINAPNGGTVVANTNGGAALSQTIASGTATMTTAAIGAGACGTTVTVAATGTLTTDVITVANNAAVAANPGVLIVNKWPTANNVNFAYCNPTAGSVTPTAATLNFRVTR